MAELSDVVAAVDVGGTRIKAALVTSAYDTLAAVTTPTPADIAADVGAVVHATVSGLLTTAAKDGRPARLVGCGVVVPGLVDEPRGVGVYSVNLGWRDLPIRDRSRRRSVCRPSSATTCAPDCLPRPAWALPAVRGTRCSSP